MRVFHLVCFVVIAAFCFVPAASAEIQTFEIGDENVIYAFTQGTPPVKTVPAGSRLVIKTKDCFANQLQTPEDTIEGVDWNQVNPASGPIYIEGAEPGDVLEIKIEKIEVGPQGVMMVDKTFGVLKDRFDGMYFRILPIKDGKIIFDDKLSVPINPMIGVIGVAPKAGLSFNTGTPHAHGGNLDSKLMNAGNTLFLPVSEKGALLATGDIHAIQGDGEICGTGVEAPATVTLVVNVRKDLSLTWPVVDDGENLMVFGSAETMDEASYIATSNMADILADRLPLDMQNINYMMSAIGDLQVSAIVNPLMCVRFSMPKKPLAEAYGFKF